jgi:hypothetical protein
MSRFTDRERAAILEQSRKILADEQPARPAREVPIPEVPIPESDPVAEWAEQADAFDREREACRAELRRESREDRRAAMRTRQDSAELDQRLDAIEARLGALELVVSGLNGVADGAAQFSTATVARLEELAALANKVDAALTTMRYVHERECNALRDRLAASEALHTRETVLLAKQLADAQRELDQRNVTREFAASRMAVAGMDAKLENVVSLVREDLEARKR